MISLDLLMAVAVILAWAYGFAFGYAYVAPASSFRSDLRKVLTFGFWT